MKVLLIDDIGVSITIRYYFDLLGKRRIIKCTNNLTGMRISPWVFQGGKNRLYEYAIKNLDKEIANRH